MPRLAWPGGTPRTGRPLRCRPPGAGRATRGSGGRRARQRLRPPAEHLGVDALLVRHRNHQQPNAAGRQLIAKRPDRRQRARAAGRRQAARQALASRYCDARPVEQPAVASHQGLLAGVAEQLRTARTAPTAAAVFATRLSSCRLFSNCAEILGGRGWRNTSRACGRSPRRSSAAVCTSPALEITARKPTVSKNVCGARSRHSAPRTGSTGTG